MSACRRVKVKRGANGPQSRSRVRSPFDELRRRRRNDGIPAVHAEAADQLTFLGLEFGTRPVMEVLSALRADHWLHSSASVDPALRADIQSQMRNAFYCESPDWQAAVYGRAADFIYRGCRGLSTSTPAQSSSKEA